MQENLKPKMSKKQIAELKKYKKQIEKLQDSMTNISEYLDDLIEFFEGKGEGPKCIKMK